MSTINYDLTQSPIPSLCHGAQQDEGGFRYVGVNTAGTSFEIHMTVTGTELSLELYGASGGTYSLSIDGVPQTNLTPAGDFTLKTIFTGLTDAAHTVDIAWVSGYCALGVSGFAQVVGASPSIATQSSYANFVQLNDGQTSGHVRSDGSIFFQNKCATAYGNGGEIAFYGNPTSIRMLTDGRACTFDLFKDGVLVGTYDLPAPDAWGIVTLVSGLTAGSVGKYVLKILNANLIQIWEVLLDSAFSTSVTLPSRKSFLMQGDSIVLAGGANYRGYPYLVCMALDLALSSFGASGAFVSGGGGLSTTIAGQCAQVLPVPPTFIHTEGGTNDYGVSTPQPSPMGAFLTDYESLISNAITASSGTTLLLCGDITPRTAASNDTTYTLSNFRAAISAAVTNAANPLVKLLPLSTWLDTANTLDGLHPSLTGHEQIANNMIPYVASTTQYGSTGYTVSLSASSGPVGTPITITYTRIAGTTWITGEAVATSDGGGGTFGAFTFTAGQPTATRTYTAGSTGTKTLTHSNSQTGWADPASSSFTSTASSPTITAATTNANGTQIVVTLSETGCTPTSNIPGFQLGAGSDGTGAFGADVISMPGSISGSNLTLTMPNGRLLYPGLTYTLTSANTTIVDGSSNPLTDVTDLLVTNASNATVPTPSAPTGYAQSNAAVLTLPTNADPNIQDLVKQTTGGTTHSAIVSGGVFHNGPGSGPLPSPVNGTTYAYTVAYIPYGFVSLASGTPSADSSALTVTPPNSPAKPAVVNASGVFPMLIAAGII